MLGCSMMTTVITCLRRLYHSYWITQTGLPISRCRAIAQRSLARLLLVLLFHIVDSLTSYAM